MDLQTIKTQTTWNQATQGLNSNFAAIDIEVEKLKNATTRDKGYYLTADALAELHPTASEGARAFVGYTAPYAVYVWSAALSAWQDTGQTISTEPTIELGDYYTRSEIDLSLSEKVDNETLELNYYKKDEVDDSIGELTNTKADLLNGKIPIDQMPVGVSRNVYLTQTEYETLVEQGGVNEDLLYFTYEE